MRRSTCRWCFWWSGGQSGGRAETSCTPQKGTFEVLAGIMEGEFKKYEWIWHSGSWQKILAAHNTPNSIGHTATKQYTSQHRTHFRNQPLNPPMISNNFILQMRPTLSYIRDQPVSCCWGSQSLALPSWALTSAPCKLAICHWLHPLGPLDTWPPGSILTMAWSRESQGPLPRAFVPLLNFESDFWSCRSLLFRVLTLGSRLVTQLCSRLSHVSVDTFSPGLLGALGSGLGWTICSVPSGFRAALASDLPDFPPAPPAGSLLHRLLGFTHSSWTPHSTWLIQNWWSCWLLVGTMPPPEPLAVFMVLNLLGFCHWVDPESCPGPCLQGRRLMAFMLT